MSAQYMIKQIGQMGIKYIRSKIVSLYFLGVWTWKLHQNSTRVACQILLRRKNQHHCPKISLT